MYLKESKVFPNTFYMHFNSIYCRIIHNLIACTYAQLTGLSNYGKTMGWHGIEKFKLPSQYSGSLFMTFLYCIPFLAFFQCSFWYIFKYKIVKYHFKENRKIFHFFSLFAAGNKWILIEEIEIESLLNWIWKVIFLKITWKLSFLRILLERKWLCLFDWSGNGRYFEIWRFPLNSDSSL